MNRFSLLPAFLLALAFSAVAPHARAESDDAAVFAAEDLPEEGAAAKKINCERIRNYATCVNTQGCAPSTNESNKVTPWTCLNVD